MKKTSPYKRFLRESLGAWARTQPGPAETPTARAPPGPAPLGPWGRSQVAATDHKAPSAHAERYSPRVLGAAGVGKGGCWQRTAPRIEPGEKGSKAAIWPGLSGPNSHTSRGTTPVKAHFAQWHFRQLSRNPGGLKALWSAPRAPPAPARRRVARPRSRGPGAA